jgi:hypothetical protein
MIIFFVVVGRGLHVRLQPANNTKLGAANLRANMSSSPALINLDRFSDSVLVHLNSLSRNIYLRRQGGRTGKHLARWFYTREVTDRDGDNGVRRLKKTNGVSVTLEK